MSKSPATPEIIANLIEKSKIGIHDSEVLLAKIEKTKIDFQSIPTSHNETFEFLQIVFELLSGSISGMYESFNGLQNMLQTDSIYEKRYHMQMINLCQFEWCILLLGKDGRGILYQLIKLFEKCSDKNIIVYLQDLTNLIKILGGKCSIVLRNVTAHYDKPLKMYQTLVLLIDEDAYAVRLGMQMEIHDKILISMNSIFSSIIANKIGPIVAKQYINEQRDGEIQAMINEQLAKALIDRLDLEEVISKQLSSAWDDIEFSNRLYQQFNKVVSFMQLKKHDSTEIKHLQSLVEIHWMVSFIRHDLACSLNNYIKASSVIERSVCLRRIYITEVAALSHLYGYNETAQDRSIWVKLSEIPEFVLNPLSKVIENELKEYIDNVDNVKRNLYTHFREDEQLNLSDRWQAFNNMNHAEELMKLQKLIILCNNIDKYLMSMLSMIQNSQNKILQETLKPILKIRELGVKQNNQSLIDTSDRIISLFDFAKKIKPV